MLRVATDVGGTFTDLVYFEIDEKSGKALSIKTAKRTLLLVVMKREFLMQLRKEM